MIIDSSALVAIAFQEPDYERVVEKLVDASSSGMGTPTLVETGIVLDARLKKDSRFLLGRMLEEFNVSEVPFGEAHWREALLAYRRFGQGHHPANLNFGDCLAYAVARLANEPLLYLGNDFAATDIASASKYICPEARPLIRPSYHYPSKRQKASVFDSARASSA
jgi:ribonuclease VapC